jgi:hypothetical protein
MAGSFTRQASHCAKKPIASMPVSIKPSSMLMHAPSTAAADACIAT